MAHQQHMKGNSVPQTGVKPTMYGK